MSTTPERHVDDVDDEVDRDPVDREPLSGSFDEVDTRPPPPPAAASWPSSATEPERSDAEVPEPADPALLDEPVIAPEASASDSYDTNTDTGFGSETDTGFGSESSSESSSTDVYGTVTDTEPYTATDDDVAETDTDTTDVSDTDTTDPTDTDTDTETETGETDTDSVDEPVAEVEAVSPVVVTDSGPDADDTGDDPVVAPVGSRNDTATTDEDGTVLVEDPSEVRQRWQTVQVAFVDDPRQAVDDAGQLVDEVVELVVTGIKAQRDSLGESWSADDLDTEQLRIALRRYRVLLDRLLAV
jgi:hypothetical protein